MDLQGLDRPGIYLDEAAPLSRAVLRSGVPAFLGVFSSFLEPAEKSAGEAKAATRRFTSFAQFENEGPAGPCDSLRYAVRGFFANGGRRCYLVRINDSSDGAFEGALESLAAEPEPDLVCCPGADVRWQARILRHCDEVGGRFAILDVPLEQHGAGDPSHLTSPNGALYYPWLEVRGTEDREGHARLFTVPPCGHVAGVYARCDEGEGAGTHKAPANEELFDVVDLDSAGSSGSTDRRVNPLRFLPGRGIRIWGARTLSRDPAWRYVSVRRTFLTAARWIEAKLAEMAFESNDLPLWIRVERELTAHFEALHRRGDLKGETPAEAFYVRCDAETNPWQEREQGRLIAEIGLALEQPSEFVVVRLLHDASGVTLSGADRSE